MTGRADITNADCREAMAGMAAGHFHCCTKRALTSRYSGVRLVA